MENKQFKDMLKEIYQMKKPEYQRCIKKYKKQHRLYKSYYDNLD